MNRARPLFTWVLVLAIGCVTENEPRDDGASGGGGKADSLDGVPTRADTALALYLAENPVAPLVGDETVTATTLIEKELIALEDHVINEGAFRMPLPWTRGWLTMRPAGALVAHLEGLLDPGEELDVATTSTGHEILDQALASNGALKLHRWNVLGGKMYIVFFDPDRNPLVVAQSFMSSLGDELEWAEPDGYLSYDRPIYRTQLGYTGLASYVLNVGWGDCPAGCIYSQRTYVEVDSTRGTALILGRSGDQPDGNENSEACDAFDNLFQEPVSVPGCR